MKNFPTKLLGFIFLLLIGLPLLALSEDADPLPTWQEGQVKQAIIDFVQEVTDPNNPGYVPPAERIATIDNDGTLWVEQPLYTQTIFAIDRVKALASQHPEWATTEPFQTILNGDMKAIAALSPQDLAKIIATTHAGMTVEAFHQLVKDWLSTAVNPHFNRPYTELVYQPMLELMAYLRANGFKIYIVTGGGQEFVRVFADHLYDVLPENIIGSAGKTDYTYQNGQPVLIKLSDVELIDDKEGKPEAINLFIGRKPIIAIGNSDGDQQMLEWAKSAGKDTLAILIHHDDAVREFAYDTDSKIGTFSAALMQEAEKNGWQIVSMAKDWKIIFPKN